MAGRDSVVSPYSTFRLAILKKLQELKFIKGYKVEEREGIKEISVDLSYKDGNPAISDIVIVSRPGQRIYMSYRHLKPILNGLGVSLISTPKGVLTNNEARRAKMGGELLFEIW